MIRVMDLFSGIGGFSLGLKKAGGFRTVAYCEIDPYCQRVLQARMLDGSLDTAPICTDITKLVGYPWRGLIDLICGGFPCQDISRESGGTHLGLAGERSGLWREMYRLVRQVRPLYVFVENVAALLDRGMGDVLGDLAKSGYDAEWSIVSACSVGASHVRERVFVLAYARGERLEGREPQRTGFGAEALPEADLRRDIPPPYVCGAVDGVPHRMDRLHALGNAVYPAAIKWIGRRLRKAAQTS